MTPAEKRPRRKRGRKTTGNSPAATVGQSPTPPAQDPEAVAEVAVEVVGEAQPTLLASESPSVEPPSIEPPPVRSAAPRRDEAAAEADDAAPAASPEREAPTEPAAPPARPARRRRRTPARVGPRIALMHDWLTGMRGGEKALEVICEQYPDAELFTLFHVPGQVSPRIERLEPRSSIVQWLPFARRYYRHYLPLFPFVVEQFDFDPFDLVISTSHCAAKSVVTPGRTRHLCYCHSPMRYAWDQYHAYFGAQRLGAFRSRAIRPVVAALARWDARTASRVDRFLANSHHVAGRISRYYNRAATVVYPPVDTAFYHPGNLGVGEYFLMVSALVPYKRIEIAIRACGMLGAPLRIVGQGPELRRLTQIAGPTVEFMGPRPDGDIRDLYRGARALLLPGEEDFGIAPVEAQACGRPVVALGRGGALETVQDGVSGVLVAETSAAAFADGLERVQQTSFDPTVIRQRAERFSRPRFADEMRTHVKDALSAPPETARW